MPTEEDTTIARQQQLEIQRVIEYFKKNLDAVKLRRRDYNEGKAPEEQLKASYLQTENGILRLSQNPNKGKPVYYPTVVSA